MMGYLLQLVREGYEVRLSQIANCLAVTVSIVRDKVVYSTRVAHPFDLPDEYWVMELQRVKHEVDRRLRP